MAIKQGDGHSIKGVLMIWFKYNDQTNRLHSIEYDLPSGKAARVTIWDDDVIVLDETVATGTGTFSLPNAKLVIEDGDLVVPPNIKYSIQIVTIR